MKVAYVQCKYASEKYYTLLSKTFWGYPCYKPFLSIQTKTHLTLLAGYFEENFRPGGSGLVNSLRYSIAFL